MYFLTDKLKHDYFVGRVTVVEVSHQGKDEEIINTTFTDHLTIGHDKKVVFTRFHCQPTLN